MTVEGVSKDTIDNLTYEDAVHLWSAWTEGAWGTIGQAERDYQVFCMLHNQTEVLIAANSKKHKVRKPPTFKEFAPKLFEFITGEVSKPEQNQQGISHNDVLKLFT